MRDGKFCPECLKAQTHTEREREEQRRKKRGEKVENSSPLYITTTRLEAPWSNFVLCFFILFIRVLGSEEKRSHDSAFINRAKFVWGVPWDMFRWRKGSRKWWVDFCFWLLGCAKREGRAVKRYGAFKRQQWRIFLDFFFWMLRFP